MGAIPKNPQPEMVRIKKLSSSTKQIPKAPGKVPSSSSIINYHWLALPVGNEGPSTFTGWYIGDETSIIPY